MQNETASELKLIRVTGQVNTPDDLSFPFKLEVNLSPPEFMSMTFVMLYGGSEDVVVRAMTKEALDTFIDEKGLRTHPRLRRIVITGPDGFRQEIAGRMEYLRNAE